MRRQGGLRCGWSRSRTCANGWRRTGWMCAARPSGPPRSEATFHVTSNGQSSSLLPLAQHLSYYPHIVEVEARTVTTTTIDALGLHPDMLNLDIQGAELEALIGGNRTLQNVRWVYTEVSSEPLYEGGVLEPELTGYLSDAGFVKVAEEWTGYGWGDALYARNGDGGSWWLTTAR
jgi:FkbM family methyltransferase